MLYQLDTELQSTEVPGNVILIQGRSSGRPGNFFSILFDTQAVLSKFQFFQ